MRHVILGMVLLAGVGFLPASALAKGEKPSGTVKISGKSVAAGVGFSWGKGTLTYHGKQHAFSIDGLSVGDVGISSATATGSVYHLENLEDFNGQYTAVSTGAAVAGGGGVATMKNASGVTMTLKATSRGLKFKIGADGVKVKLEE